MDCREWKSNRIRALERLKEHSMKGFVDRDIEEFLFKLNSIGDCMYTTSSCSGRVAVLRGADVFDKRSAEILDSWHDPDDCREGVKKYHGYSSKEGIVWLSLQPPILHLAVLGQDLAEETVSCAVASGFARAGYRAMKPCGYHVEIAAYDKIHLFLPAPAQTIDGLCTILSKYKSKLLRLEECLSSIKCV